jgi:hypothetical protein
MATGNDELFEAWKQQMDIGMRVLDAMVQGAAKMRAAQLAAANETHQRTVEVEKLILGAQSPHELWTAQWNWAISNCSQAVDYWRAQLEAMTEANARIVSCVQDQARGAAEAAKKPQ